MRKSTKDDKNEILIYADQNAESIKRFIELVAALDKRGLIEPIIGALEDEDTFSKAMRCLSSDFVMNLLLNIDSIIDALNKLDLENLSKAIAITNNALNAISAKDIKEVNGLLDMMHQLHDPDIKKGLGLVFAILKSIGSYYNR
ncbi:MAG: hypothetical protein ARM1_0741 [Candidatus Micrarchaeota archaeon]|nr:MAG: hypothetical protein ARM1_0741 [Candidatus Micrarchaeota archaeon]